MSPSILKSTWLLKKFSLKKTPALIKRDMRRLFRSRGRAEKCAEETQQRARLEMDLNLETPVFYRYSNTTTQERVPLGLAYPLITPTRTPRAAEPQSMDTITTSESKSSNFPSPSTAITEPSSDTSPHTFNGAPFFPWDSAEDHWVDHGALTILRIALRACSEHNDIDEVGGAYETTLWKIISTLHKDSNHEDSTSVALAILSLADINFPSSWHTRAFLHRIGHPSTPITTEETGFIHSAFGRILRNDRFDLERRQTESNPS
ncbi:hypothetical protein BU23DRAFT_179088 [Bimuria novae-zelandiae CBS 107.79]|uniref:Uncharacterized protein n=1 Tax=Bimuria novae-zelandiae CBS 107.79 TaxID=1447943 RepID=A0A6A5V3I0_9PLEO|nr:hypothetical protein BU23DRAFT_179088 [Bimuria novae-zelandiae CBS 107.79]